MAHWGDRSRGAVERWRDRPRASLRDQGQVLFVVPALLVTAWVALIVQGAAWIAGTAPASPLVPGVMLPLVVAATIWVVLFVRRPVEPPSPTEGEAIDWSTPDVPRL